jgi:hypothetical protein
MKKIILLTALLALVSVNANAWPKWFHHYEPNHHEQCPKPVNVPDGGSSAVLLGLSCAGLYLVKRKTRS